MARISDRVRRLVFERDGWRCVHCGETAAIGLQHRVSKGMGGSRNLDNPANLLTFCNIGNAAMESDARLAQWARDMGWKLSRWDDPEQSPFFDYNTGEWNTLTNFFARERSI